MLWCLVLFKTVVSSRGRVVIPKPIRDALGLTPGTILRVRVDGKRVVLEPITEPPKEIFVKAKPEAVNLVLREAKSSSDKARKLLEALGVKGRLIELS